MGTTSSKVSPAVQPSPKSTSGGASVMSGNSRASTSATKPMTNSSSAKSKSAAETTATDNASTTGSCSGGNKNNNNNATKDNSNNNKSDDTIQEKPNDYELAIKSCKELEFILETEFGSTGSNLHEMITNANASLPIELIMNMRYVATIGNNLVHEKSFSYIPDQEEFIKRYERSVKALNEISHQRRLVERRVVEAKQKKREAEIQEALMNEDREWLDRQHREVTAQKARRMEQERERDAAKKRAELKRKEAAAARSSVCACF